MASIENPGNGPLNQAHHAELVLANQRAATIRKAAKVAAFNGWMFGIFAALSAPFAISSVSGVLITAGLAGVAFVEFLGRKRLLSFDPSAATLLGWNQIAVLTLMTVYCGWMLFESLTGGGSILAELKASPGLTEALGSAGNLEHLYRMLAVGLYGSVIAVTVIFQGWNAVYYFTRRKHIEEYVRETPAWIIDLQRLMPAA